MKRRLPLALWPVAVAAVAGGFVLLFDSEAPVTPVAVINRAVGGSFLISGLIVWQRRADSRSGPLMVVTGFLFVAQVLVAAIGAPLTDTLAEVVANRWVVPLATLVLGFPSGRLAARGDRLIVAVLFAVAVPLQVVWLLFRPFPPGMENVLLVSPDTGVADAIDTFQRWLSATMALAAAAVGMTRWLRAAPALRRLLLPTLAGAVAVLILGAQGYYRVFADEFMRSSQEVTAVVLVSVPLAFLAGMLRVQLARAGMADLVVALQRAPDSKDLGARLARALRDPSLELVYWLPGFECYVDAGGTAVALPAETSGRAVTEIAPAGDRVGALIHDAALRYEPELAAYFVISEGLANVAKYAGASRAPIRVGCTNGVALIEVSDDGVGGADAAAGSGLRGLADRVEAIGGRLRVASPAGGGTVLTAELPCTGVSSASSGRR